MSDHNRPSPFAPVPRAPTHPGQILDVLFISRFDSDAAALAKILSGTHWNLIHVRTCPEALATLDIVLVPVVLCDVAIACGWKQLVSTIIHSNHPAPILLTSGGGDWHLWEQAIDHGAFEVLHKPFERDHVVTALDSALRHWETGKTRRLWDAMGA